MDSALPEPSDRRPIVHGISSLQQSSAVHQLLPHPVCAHSATGSPFANAAFPASKKCPRSERGAPRWRCRLAPVAPQSRPASATEAQRRHTIDLNRLSGCCPATRSATPAATSRWHNGTEGGKEQRRVGGGYPDAGL